MEVARSLTEIRERQPHIQLFGALEAEDVMKSLETPGTLPGHSGLNSRIIISLSLYTYIYISVHMYIRIYVCTHETSGDSIQNKLLQGEPRHTCSPPSSAKMMHHRMSVASLRAESPRVISVCGRNLWGLKHLVRD